MNLEVNNDEARIFGVDTERIERLRRRLDQRNWKLKECLARHEELSFAIQKLKVYVELAPAVSDALEALSTEMFEQDLRLVESKMTIALREVLGQSVEFKAETTFKHNVACVDFSIERNGNPEDIRRGQGGSVHNILSVGLRMFALTMLDEVEHRRFLVLDEQDCWLQPELVSKLVKIVHQAGKELDYQVIMISHHKLSHFEDFADRIYRFVPVNNEVSVEQIDPSLN